MVVDGATRVQASIADVVFSVPKIIHELSKYWTLAAGDLIYTGTPAGVAALGRGDRFRAELEGVAMIEGEIV